MIHQKIILIFILLVLFINTKAQITIQATLNCTGDTSFLNLSSTNNIDSVQWIFFGNVNDTINTFSANKIFIASGNNNVSVTYYISGMSYQIDTILNVRGVPQVYIYDYNGCAFQFFYNATSPGATYLWNNGSTSATLTSDEPGIFWVNVTNECGTGTDTGIIIFSYPPADSFPENITLCNGTIDTLFAGPTTNQYSWQDESNLNYFVVTQSNQYSVLKLNQCGSLLEFVTVFFVGPPSINFFNDTAICNNSIVHVNASAPMGNIKWWDGTSSPIKYIHASGIYYVTASNVCDTISDTVNIKYRIKPIVEIGSDTLLCAGNSLSFAVDDYKGFVLWNDGSTNLFHTVYPNFDSIVKISVTITNECGTASDSFNLRSSYMSLDFPGDTLLCVHDILPIDIFINDSTTTYLWSNGTTNHYIELSKPGLYAVTVSNGCGTLSDKISITNYDCINCAKLPAAFSPNGDGLNDIFRPITECNIVSLHFKIFNRWGEMVYNSYDIYNNGWNGFYNLQPQPVGSYVYILDYEWWDGNSKLSDTKTGNVTLVR